jgi:hypothetical protein
VWRNKPDTTLVDPIEDGVKNVITESTNSQTKLLSSKLREILDLIYTLIIYGEIRECSKQERLHQEVDSYL